MVWLRMPRRSLATAAKNQLPRQEALRQVRRMLDVTLMPFTLSVTASTLGSEVGRGVIVRTVERASIPFKTVLCMYPGTVYRKPPSSEYSYPHELTNLKERSYLLKRANCFLDASCADLRTFGGAPLRLEKHPYACGQFVNHPPLGARPNVAAVDLVIQLDELAPHILALLPNRFARTWYADAHGREFPLPRQSALPCVLLVTLQDIEDGDELLLDYSYPPYHKPPWYHPVERDESDWYRIEQSESIAIVN